MDILKLTLIKFITKPTYPAGIHWSRLYFKTGHSFWANGDAVKVRVIRDMEVLYDRIIEKFEKGKNTFIELPPFDVGRDRLTIKKIGGDGVSRLSVSKNYVQLFAIFF